MSAVLNAVGRWLTFLLGQVERAERSLAGVSSEQRMRRRAATPDFSEQGFPGPPPAHWLERARPQPPEHWLALVRDKAPLLLDPENHDVFQVGPPPAMTPYWTASADSMQTRREDARKRAKPRPPEAPARAAPPMALHPASDDAAVFSRSTELAEPPNNLRFKTARLHAEPNLNAPTLPPTDEPPVIEASDMARWSHGESNTPNTSQQRESRLLAEDNTPRVHFSEPAPRDPLQLRPVEHFSNDAAPETPMTLTRPAAAPEILSTMTRLPAAPVIRPSASPVERETISLPPGHEGWPSLPDELAAVEEHEAAQRALRAWQHLQQLEHEQRGTLWSE